MSAPLTTERHGSVLLVILNRPARRNALSLTLLTELGRVLTAPGEEISGIVLTGAGAAFSAGADFADVTGTPADVAFDDAVERVAAAIGASPVPVVAALEGPCLGAAAHLALACDVRVAGAGAFLQIPALRLGLLYSPRAIAWLAAAYRRDTVRRLLLLGERFTADTAAAAGLVSWVVPAGTAADAAIASLATLPEGSRPALTATRTLLGELERGEYDDAAWQARRRTFLASPARAAAVAQAKHRHP